MENNEMATLLQGLTIEEATALLNKAQKQTSIVFNDVGRNGPTPTLGNSRQLFKHYAIEIKHNEMSKETEISIPSKTFFGDTEANASIGYIQSLYRDQNLPVSDMMDHITIVANENHYHPVRDWIDAVEWDGVSRMNDYYATLVSDTEIHEDPAAYEFIKEVMMRKWAMSAVAALYHYNFSCEGVLVIHGEQAAGKTSWVMNLLPPAYQTIWFKDAVVLDTNNKDSLYKGLSTWVTELGELDATLKRSDLEALKGFVTEKVDYIRPPYERKSNKYQRRTVFLGTVNQLRFLSDDENRRFWTVSVSNIIPPAFDIQQFWAEIKVLYMSIKDKCSTSALRAKNNEYGWFLSPSERKILQEIQNPFKHVDPVEERMAANMLPVVDMVDGEWMNCTQILDRCRVASVTRVQTNIAAKWLKANGYSFQKRTKKFYIEFKPYEQETFKAVQLSGKLDMLRSKTKPAKSY
jgi:putative DNA primase/helicase